MLPQLASFGLRINATCHIMRYIDLFWSQFVLVYRLEILSSNYFTLYFKNKAVKQESIVIMLFG